MSLQFWTGVIFVLFAAISVLRLVTADDQPEPNLDVTELSAESVSACVGRFDGSCIERVVV